MFFFPEIAMKFSSTLQNLVTKNTWKSDFYEKATTVNIYKVSNQTTTPKQTYVLKIHKLKLKNFIRYFATYTDTSVNLEPKAISITF